MTFIWMDMLWLLALVPVLIGAYIWLLRRRKKSALRYANLAIVKQAMGKGVGWRRHVPPALFLAAITVLSSRWRGPRRWSNWRPLGPR